MTKVSAFTDGAPAQLADVVPVIRDISATPLNRRVTLEDILSLAGAAAPAGAVGDGATDDTTALQAALTAGVLFLAPGKTYRITSALSAPAGALVHGGGTLLRSDNGTTGTQNRPAFITLNAVDDVVIDGITFSHTGADEMMGITTLDAEDIRISNCAFINGCCGVFVYRLSKRVLVENCTFNGCELFGCATGGDTAGNTAGTVEDVTFANCTFKTIPDEAIDINFDTVGFKIVGNTFSDCQTGNTGGMVEVGTGTTACSNGTISGNLFDGGSSVRTSILIKDEVRNVTVSGNSHINMATTGTTGVVTIDSNSASEPKGISISGETIRGGYSGIVCEYGAFVSISGCTLADGGAGFAIEAEANASEVAITGCTVKDWGGFGIVIRCNRAIVDGNRIGGATSAGIRVTAGDYQTVTNNHVFDCGQEGIKFDNGVDQVICTGNQTVNNTGEGIECGTGADYIVRNNNSTGNTGTDIVTGSLTGTNSIGDNLT